MTRCTYLPLLFLHTVFHMGSMVAFPVRPNPRSFFLSIDTARHRTNRFLDRIFGEGQNTSKNEMSKLDDADRSMLDPFFIKMVHEAKDPNCIFLDARSKEEIVLEPCMVPTIHGEMGETLNNVMSLYLQVKASPIIVFCKSGKRASRVQAALQESGYTNVMNAGGVHDVNRLFPDGL